jgi:hypothetical protein
VTAAADTGAPAPSLLDLDLGFLALPRRLCGSSFVGSLRADERFVLVTMLLRAQYRAGEFWFAGRRIPLDPGQFIDSEEQLARAAGSSRKVVRTVYRKAEAAGLLTRSKAHPAGQCPSVTTFLDYERIRYAGGEVGPRTEPPAGHEGAKNGPVTGQEGAPSEQRNPGEPSEPLNREPRSSPSPSPSAPARPPRRPEGEGSRHQATIALFCRLWMELRGGTYRIAEGGKDGAAVKRLLRYPEATDEEIERRMRAAFADEFFRTKAGGLAFFIAKWSAWEPPSAAVVPLTTIAPAAPEAAFTGKAGGFGS